MNIPRPNARRPPAHNQVQPELNAFAFLPSATTCVRFCRQPQRPCVSAAAYSALEPVRHVFPTIKYDADASTFSLLETLASTWLMCDTPSECIRIGGKFHRPGYSSGVIHRATRPIRLTWWGVGPALIVGHRAVPVVCITDLCGTAYALRQFLSSYYANTLSTTKSGGMPGNRLAHMLLPAYLVAFESFTARLTGSSSSTTTWKTA